MGRRADETRPIRRPLAPLGALAILLFVPLLLAGPAAVGQSVGSLDIDIEGELIPHGEPIGNEPGRAEVHLRVECNGIRLPGPTTITIDLRLTSGHRAVDTRLEDDSFLIRYDPHDCTAGGRTDEFNTNATIGFNRNLIPGYEVDLMVSASHGDQSKWSESWTESVGTINDWNARTNFGEYVLLEAKSLAKMQFINQGNIPIELQVEEVDPLRHGTWNLPETMSLPASINRMSAEDARLEYKPQSLGQEEALVRVTAVHAEDPDQDLGEKMVPVEFLVVESSDYFGERGSRTGVPVGGPDETPSPWVQAVTVLAALVALLVIWRQRWKARRKTASLGNDRWVEPDRPETDAPAAPLPETPTDPDPVPSGPYHVKTARSPRR